MRAFSLLTLLLPFVAANDHNQCDCWTWSAGGAWTQNAELTHYACTNYRGQALYDENSKRCKTIDGNVIDGQDWEDACIRYGVHKGYFPMKANGWPDYNKEMMTVGAAVGSCPNRG
ncbi:hypothetical protein E4U13_004432 [Claviceps humidiphila]|uniref:Uncharacterized protein n=1 Tax=Claviceps humidiphila TaxID=1294629 RepID=A0A9P7PW83_9HYPO|nr:hypothetical protein E4U13_004432 [Claviceps humidiphila]